MIQSSEGIAALQPDEHTVLGMLAALQTVEERAGVINWLRKLGLRKRSGQAFLPQDVRETLERLLQHGLLREAGERQYAVPEVHRHAVLAGFHEARSLEPLSAAIRRVEPLHPQGEWAPSGRALMRELSWGMHMGVDAAALQLYAAWSSSYPGPGREVLLLQACGSHPPAEGLQRWPAALVKDCLTMLLGRALTELERIPESLITHAGTAQLGAAELELLALYLALRGDHPRALALCSEFDAPSSWGVRALLALIRGDGAEARRLARLGLQLESAAPVVVDGPSGVWLALLLLTDHRPDSHARARAQIEHLRRVANTRVLRCLEMIDALSSHGPQALPPNSDQLSHPNESWIEVLFFGLVARYRGDRVGGERLGRLQLLAAEARERGFASVQQLLEVLVEGAPEHALLRLYDAEPAWQRQLRALEVALVSAPRSAEPEGPQERVAWSVMLAADGGAQLSARLQARGPGGWSSGRQVSWKRLAAMPPSAADLNDHDRRVLKHLRRERHGSQTMFVLEPAALLELVGHPAVYVESTHVEVTSAAARLVVHELEGAIRLAVEPEALLARPIVCERASRDRLTIYALDAAQRAVIEVFAGKAIELPAGARAPLQATLAKLASDFAVASEHAIAGGQIAEIQADGPLHVRLRRLAGGLGVRVCVVPLAAAAALTPGQGSPRLVMHVPQRGSVCVVRDLAGERERLGLLYASCPTLSELVGHDHEGRVDELDRCLELLCELRGAADVRVEWPEGEPLTLAPERDLPDVKLRLEANGNWLGAEGELAIDDSTCLALHELLSRAASARGRFIELADGRYLAFTKRLKKALEGMSALALVEDTRVALHPLWLGVASEDETFAEVACDAQVSRLLERMREANQLSPVLPAGFEAELRPYQHEGYAWLCRLAHVRAGACLADDMGLGKTLQALALLLAEASHGPSLVIAPTSVCVNWLNEARRFAPQLRVTALTSSTRSDSYGAFDLVVCSYGLLVQEFEALSKRAWKVLIVDEAQAIKNASTQRARAVQGLNAEIRVALTGTPIENHLGELWSLMHFLNPGLLGSAKDFEERFTKPIARDADARASRTLKRLIRPFILRRRKSEVLDDLPPKTEITLRIEPSAEERALFQTMRDRALSRFASVSGEAPRTTHIQLLAELTRLRRAACHPQLVVPEAQLASSKLEAFEALLTELRDGGHRALVFSQFVDYLALVRARLDELGVAYAYLDGSSTPNARNRAVSEFQAGQGELFLISLKAGGFGLNLTAADYVVHLDPWWNPAVEAQASDRAHRIGQARPVTVYRLVMQDSIEERILALHAHKRDLADQLLEGTGAAAALSLDDMLALLAAPHS